MPQLLILAVVAVGGFYAFKFVKREIGRVGSELDKTRRAGGPRPRQTLEQDSESGRYRPRDKG